MIEDGIEDPYGGSKLTVKKFMTLLKADESFFQKIKELEKDEID